MGTERVNIQFVQEVEKYPCLYDSRLPEYSRREATEKAWDEIGAKFQLAGAECKERWKNLRSVFVRHLKPAKNGSGKSHKKPYYLAEYMQFAIPFIKTMPGVDTPENSKKSSHEVYIEFRNENDEETDDNCVPISSESIYEPESINPLQKLETTTRVTQPSPSPSEHSEPERISVKRKRNDFYEQNSNKMFLLSLLSDMNKMNDKQRRVFKRKILGLVEDILDGDDNNYYNAASQKPKNSSVVILTPNNINDILDSADNTRSLTSEPSSMVIKTEYEEGR